jgi:integrase
MAKGIEERHARSCRSRNGGRCDCEPTYRPYVWDARAREQLRGKPTKSYAEAAGWRRDALIAVRRGRATKRTALTLEQAGEAWLEGARAGLIRARGGHQYKPATVRAYEQALRLRAYPALGAEPVDEIGRADLQELIDDLNGKRGASTIETTVNAIRAIYGHEIGRDRLQHNPTRGVKLPAAGPRRERFATPAEAKALVAALPIEDQPVWATAFYGGLRRGELMALRDEAIDLDAGEIRVVAGWDVIAGEQPTKGRERRTVPIIGELRGILAAHRLRSGRRGRALTFGATDTTPFAPTMLRKRADAAWADAGLKRITLHACRHTFTSIAIAAGVNIGTVSAALGHASVTVTWDRYHHLLPGTMDEAAELIQAYIDGAG